MTLEIANRNTNISVSTAQHDQAMQAHLAEHLTELQEHWGRALQQHGFAGAWLSAGEAAFDFQDDHGPKFKANPYLCQWIHPQYLNPGARLLVVPGQQPILFLHRPEDYWHAPAPLPEELADYLDVRPFAEVEALLEACQRATPAGQNMAHIGPDVSHNETFGEPNPTGLTHYLHYHRAKKSAYELAAMRAASDVGVRGHQAALASFTDGGSEFDIHMAYLAASSQAEVDLPYGNIVALNEHASVLHYQHQDREHSKAAQSLLIDAGGTYRGYASDITRTYGAEGASHSDFAELLALMESHQQQLVANVKPGVSFADLHVQMHQQLAQVLVDARLVNCSADAAFSEGITEAFCPHGLGHLLGLQVHDVGGHLADETGRPAPPPANYPSLRFTRGLDIDHVFTIEPGLYFIPSLLQAQRDKGADINWLRVEALSSYGGIRIEDNVRVLADGVENLTRDAFARLSHGR